MMSFVFTTTQKIQNLQYDRKNQKSDQFTDRQAYAGTSNNDKIDHTGFFFVMLNKLIW